MARGYKPQGDQALSNAERQGGATAEALEAIVDLDLTSLTKSIHHAATGAIEPKSTDRTDKSEEAA